MPFLPALQRSTRLGCVAALFLIFSGMAAQAQAPAAANPAPAGDAAPGDVTPGAGVPGTAIPGAGDATRIDATPGNAAPLSLATSPQTWTTFKGDWQRSGASQARLALPLNLVWRHSTDAAPGPITTSPLVAGPAGLRRIYFSIGKGVYCLDAQFGTQLWRVDLDGTVRAPLSLLGGGEGGDSLIASTANGIIVALRPSDGIIRWQIETKTAYQGVAPVLITTTNGQRLLVSDGNGNLIAYAANATPDADGNITPDPDFSLKLGRGGTSPASTPVLDTTGQRIFVVGRDQNLYGISLKDQLIDFQVPLRAGTTSVPALLGEALVVGAGDHLMGIYTDSGQVKWQTTLDGRILASPAGSTTGNTVYAGTVGHTLNAVDLEDGTLRWKVDLGASVSGTPLVLPNAVVVGTRNGLIYALKPEDGTILWCYRLYAERLIKVVKTPAQLRREQQTNKTQTGQANPPAPNGTDTKTDAEPTTLTKTFGVSSAPAAVDGLLYVIADNAGLYAFSDALLDAEAPRVLNASLIVRSADGTRVPLELRPSRPVLVPGKSPISFLVQLEDLGSGIDGSSFQVTFNGTPVAPADITWSAPTGRLFVPLTKSNAGKPTVLADGVYKIGVIARDYKGNVLPYTALFTVDKTVKPPAAPAKPDDTKTKDRKTPRTGR